MNQTESNFSAMHMPSVFFWGGNSFHLRNKTIQSSIATLTHIIFITYYGCIPHTYCMYLFMYFLFKYNGIKIGNCYPFPFFISK